MLQLNSEHNKHFIVSFSSEKVYYKATEAMHSGNTAVLILIRAFASHRIKTGFFKKKLDIFNCNIVIVKEYNNNQQENYCCCFAFTILSRKTKLLSQIIFSIILLVDISIKHIKSAYL